VWVGCFLGFVRVLYRFDAVKKRLLAGFREQFLVVFRVFLEGILTVSLLLGVLCEEFFWGFVIGCDFL